MKKIFCQIVCIYVLIFTISGNVVSAIETGDGAYHLDQIFIENLKKTIKTEEANKLFKKDDVGFESQETKLPENRMDDTDEVDKEFLFQTQKPVAESYEDRPLFKKMLEKGIIRTDIPSYLLKDELTYNVAKGPVEKVQFFGAYNGYISPFWSGGDYDTKYETNILQAGVTGKFRNSQNEFKLILQPRGVHGRSYMQNLLADAYVANNSIPHHQILFGYSFNQVGKEGGSGAYILPFIARSQLARNFGGVRALGVRAVGSYDLVDYSIAFNSSDRYFRKWFAGPEFTGWVDFKPLGKTDGKYGKLVLGSGISTGKNDSHYTVGSFYVGYKYKKLWSRFEYGIADGYNGAHVVNKKAEGFYGVVGYKITPKLQILGRYDQFNPDRNISGDTRKEYTAGINYFIKGQALRLIFNYVFCQNRNSSDSHRIMFGTQVLF